ncbi:hypothetical protein LCGC14_2789050, partial [marine sediment metagenome]
MNAVNLSIFSPSLLSHEALETIFVQRENELSRAIELIKESATTKNKHYMLWIGPRGTGKTHLVSLAYYRVRKNSKLNKVLRIAWLREEEYGITSWFDLLKTIIQAVAE